MKHQLVFLVPESVFLDMGPVAHGCLVVPVHGENPVQQGVLFASTLTKVDWVIFIEFPYFGWSRLWIKQPK